MSDSLAATIAISGVLVACWLLPWFGMRALMPTLREGKLHVSNYRGRSVTPGLGIVWILWSAGVMLLLAADAFLSFWDGYAPIMVVSVVAVVASFVFGFLDDVFDSGTAKGFRGHISQLREGRLSTGLLKLIGIGTVALLLGGGMAFYASETPFALAALLRGATIALAANTMNLLDVRPGRALKVYGVTSIILVAATLPIIFSGTGELELWPVVLLLPFFGPLAAVWRYDLAEEGMLGDAGANPAGALLGVYVAAMWPIWAVSIVAAILFGMNLASEKWSFSTIIDRSQLLRKLDQLGRVR